MKNKQKVVLPTVLCALGALLASQLAITKENMMNSAETASQQSTANEQVKSSIVTMVNAIDSKKWDSALTQFANEVFVDYSSLTGLQGSKTKAADLLLGWKKLLAKVDTLHQLSNFAISIEGDSADSFSHVYASHQAEGIDYWDAYGRYHHKLKKIDGRWKIVSMTLHMHGQKGNLNFLNEVTKMNQSTSQQSSENTIRKIQFESEGDRVVGNLYLPKHYDPANKYPAVIVSGSWTTVKEQMSGLYGKKLAEKGFITLAYDPRNFGESGGKTRFYENPSQKVEDIVNAVTYLQSLPEVDGNKIGALGICAGSMYTLMAAAEDKRIKSVVTAASWLHDAKAVKLFYGGEEGVQAKINAAKVAKKKYVETGEVEYIPSISTTDESAAMYGPYDYYLNSKRGAVPQWSADKFAVMTWEDWLTLDPMPVAKNLETPTLMIHSDGAVLPQYTKQFFENIAADDKSLHWIETELESPYHQFSFYDQEREVMESIEQAQLWFSKSL
ncbi:alpha/beta fold hydrolase [Pseudoalteromonas obscura]|uniref:Nuclear transport factor 2 family protein n=1 Tax=Pseudoalteromonas obscura TaxID=3048491 RepID=A0ABT7EP38_9GAMM|nr:alpha/beta fold hydrolase [Pseudoalteromonas sp. P94(2023)]MDK2596821.1 nuclear transport factor 2 family protein [Pseudoalteromonas sp. P94(2023)]